MSFHLQVYLVRLWLGGCWRDIIVDDRLPCIGNGRSTCAEDPHQPVGKSSGPRGQAWLEKGDGHKSMQPHIKWALEAGWLWVLDGFGGSPQEKDLTWPVIAKFDGCFPTIFRNPTSGNVPRGYHAQFLIPLQVLPACLLLNAEMYRTEMNWSWGCWGRWGCWPMGSLGVWGASTPCVKPKVSSGRVSLRKASPRLVARIRWDAKGFLGDEKPDERGTRLTEQILELWRILKESERDTEEITWHSLCKTSFSQRIELSFLVAGHSWWRGRRSINSPNRMAVSDHPLRRRGRGLLGHWFEVVR